MRNNEPRRAPLSGGATSLAKAIRCYDLSRWFRARGEHGGLSDLLWLAGDVLFGADDAT